MLYATWEWACPPQHITKTVTLETPQTRSKDLSAEQPEAEPGRQEELTSTIPPNFPMNEPATTLPPVIQSIRCTDVSHVPCSIIVDKDGFMVDQLTGLAPRLDAKEGTLVNVTTHRDACRAVERMSKRSFQSLPIAVL